jgi:plasmid maintenance system antidote protein VapI
MDLRQLLAVRGITMDAAAILGRRDKSTISRVAAGKWRAQPDMVVALAKALGMSARRVQGACDESWRAAHPAEAESSCPAA